MEFTGSLWRVKQRSMSMAILPQPMSYYDWINTSQLLEVPSNLYLEEGSIVVVGDDELFTTNTAWRRNDILCQFQTFRRVVAPAPGYLNSTYFHKDSLWLERLA